MTSKPPHIDDTPLRFLEGGGEMGRLIRAHDWASSALGAPNLWPAPLRTALRILLTTGHPVFLFWGPEHRCFYNDAYARSLGPEKHPRILGRPGLEAWPEIWGVIGPQIEQVMTGGEATWHENQLVPIIRNGKLDPVYWTYSYGPVDDPEQPHGVGGVLVLVSETTQAVFAHQRLEAADARWRSLFDQAPGFVCILVGPEHRFEFANPRYAELMGGRALIGKTVLEAVPEVADQGFMELLDTVYTQGVAWTGTATPLAIVDPADGVRRQVFLDFVYQPIRDEAGAVTGIFVLGFDASERERAGAELALSEARYRTLAEQLPGSAVFAVDLDLRYTMATGEALSACGLSPADFVGRAVGEVIGAGATRSHVDHYRQALAGDRFEIQHSERGRHFLTRGVPWRDAAGAVGGALAVSIDVTERQAVEAELARAKAKLEGVLASAEVGVWSWDLQSNVIEQDANVARLYGLPASDRATADDHWARIVPEDRAAVVESIAKAMQSGAFYVREFRVRSGADGVRWLAGRGKLARDEAGRPHLLTGLVMDIGDLKQLEESLRESDRQKDEFLAMLAHELRNPLASLSNVGEILARIGSPDPRAVNANGILRRQVKQLTRLVDDLMDVSRITQKKISLTRAEIALHDVVSQAVETVGPVLDEKQHRISVESNASIRVTGDLLRLVQCLVNVLANAAKYTEPGGGIEVRTRVEGDEACIRVSDSGVGIAPDLLPHVFDLFVQGKRTLDRAQGGLGIGLSVVKRLVEMHGGRVQAASEGAGRGTTIEIRLPLARTSVTGEAATGTEAVRPLNILVVDDNVDAADVLRFMLELDGHQVESVHSSSEALARIVEAPPDFALLDIGLPELDGFELARRIRASGAAPDVRLIAITGYGQVADRERAEAAGFDRYFVKPVEHAALAEALLRLAPG